MLQVYLNLWTCGVTGQRQRLVGGKVIRLVGVVQTLGALAHASRWIAGTGREKVHEQQMHTRVQRVHGLGGEFLDGSGAILVGRRDDL